MSFLRGIAIAASALWLAAGSGAAMAGPDDDIKALMAQVNTLRDAGNEAAAVPLAEKALAIAQQMGPEPEAAIAPLLALGAIEAGAALIERGNWGKAENYLTRALALREKYPGEDKHPDLAKLLKVMAAVYSGKKNHSGAEVYFQRYFQITESRIDAKKLRPDDPEVSQALTAEWNGFLVRGRVADMEKRYQRMIALTEQHLGAGHPYTAILVFQLATGEELLQGPVPSMPLFERFVALAKKALADPATDLGPSVTREILMDDLSRAADRLTMVGQLSKAREALTAVRNARAADAAQEAAVAAVVTGADADAIAQRADELDKRANGAGALPLRKRVLELRQQTLASKPGDGRAQAAVIASCQQLADYYYSNDLADGAEPMLKCVLQVREAQGGKLEIAGALGKLGDVYERLGRLGEAEEALKRAIALTGEAKGADSVDIAPLRIRVASLMALQGRAAEGAKYAEAAAAASAKLFERPPGARNALSDLDKWDERAQPRYSAVEWRGMQTVHQMMGQLGPDSPNLAGPLAFAGSVFQYSKDWANAVNYLDRAQKLVTASFKRGGAIAAEEGAGAGVFTRLAQAGYRLSEDEPGNAAQLRDRMFVAAQWAQHSAAAPAISQIAARLPRDPALASLARERQDLAGEQRGLNASLLAAVSLAPEARQREAQKSEEARKRLAAIDKRIEEIDAALLKRFPKYAALVNPAPLNIAAVQAQLRHGEALVLFLDAPASFGLPGETIAWALTADSARWARIGLGGAAMTEAVFALRCGLDEAAWQGPGATACEAAVKAKNTYPDKPLPYDLDRAYGLYQTLFGPFEDFLKDKRLLIVASGPLASLPLETLVTEKPAEALPSSWQGYRGVKWLGRKQALAVLPSVASFAALRKEGRSGNASEAFLGYGDPKLEGNPQCGPAEAPKACPGDAAAGVSAPDKHSWAAKGFGGYLGGGRASIAALKTLCPMPEASMELKCVAKNLGAAAAGRVNMGEAASEAAVKRARLDQYRVLHFATHGLLAGPAAAANGAAAEAALVLTPPQEAGEEDDGLLTASEISQLKLNADWVVLSGCNTAGDEKAGAETLSGLAGAFFYAGARSLLISHWGVDSYTASILTAGTLKELASAPGNGAAMALQKSKIALMDDEKRPWNAHPSFWAAFAMVGEGGRGGARSAPANPPAAADTAKTQPAAGAPKNQGAASKPPEGAAPAQTPAGETSGTAAETDITGILSGILHSQFHPEHGAEAEKAEKAEKVEKPGADPAPAKPPVAAEPAKQGASKPGKTKPAAAKPEEVNTLPPQ
jgi:CHAT domain-containing protein/tetratricopeptide (TPR) repeat protein